MTTFTRSKILVHSTYLNVFNKNPNFGLKIPIALAYSSY